MAEANQKKLYEHFLKSGQTEQAEAILNVYPQFKVVPKEAPKKKEVN